MKKLSSLFLILLLFNSCHFSEGILEETTESSMLAENVIIVVIDGPRYQDTWGDNTRKNIPVLSSLAEEGVFFRNFYNEENTYTLSGHTAITTGTYEYIKNNGSERPGNPSIFQAYLADQQLPPDEAFLITSKEKLIALADTKNLKWRGSYLPATDIVEREDSATVIAAIDILKERTPSLALIHFKGPDHYGHNNDWSNYIKSIQETDEYVGEIWSFIQSDPHYTDKTALFITNDHGRHLDGLSTGFQDHGDKCEGCKHISLLALGPDYDAAVIDKVYGQVDIAPTIANILGFHFSAEGEVIEELVNQ